MTCPMLSYSARNLFFSCRYGTVKQAALFVVELYLKWVLLSEITLSIVFLSLFLR